jgi:cobalt-precorrin-5B (C1)-methyltransferase
VESKNKKLRSGFTTGACAAAAAKAATQLLLSSKSGVQSSEKILEVTIPFPDGSRKTFTVNNSELRTHNSEPVAAASIIKDAGDDPDVTHGAEIVAAVRSDEFGARSGEPKNPEIIIKGGKGVGTVTKPGLAMPVGEAAINPVPRKMIQEAVLEAVSEYRLNTPHSDRSLPSNAFIGGTPNLEVTISVPAGEELAKKTLNHRLGIVGGISILGTSGIVRPISAEAWTATITASMDVAKAAGLGSVVISSGRTSEKAHMKKYHFPDEAYAMMGDYLEFSLNDAKLHGFREVHLCAQWAKMVKAAMGTPQTHVRNGALEAAEAADFLIKLGIELPREKAFNTSREIFDYINSVIPGPQSAMTMVCTAAKRYAEGITLGIPVIAHLVSYQGDILAESE